YAEGAVCKFVFQLSAWPCVQDYTILWNVTGATPTAGVKNDGPSYQVILPDPSVLVQVSVSLVFTDGTMATGSLAFHSFQRAKLGGASSSAISSRSVSSPPRGDSGIQQASNQSFDPTVPISCSSFSSEGLRTCSKLSGRPQCLEESTSLNL